MIKRTVKVINKTGLHARPASIFAGAATKFVSNITLEKDGITSNGKSIIGILTLGISKDSLVTIIAEGDDEQNAVKTLAELIESGLGEE